MSFSATDPFPHRTFSAKDVNSWFAPFPLDQIWNPLGIWGRPLSLAHFLASVFHVFPPLQSITGWFTDVANRHLPQMNYFSKIPPPGSQIPRPDMLSLVSTTAYGMGGYELDESALRALSPITSKEYQVNDGTVNTKSMSGPRHVPIHEEGLRTALQYNAAAGQY